MALAVYYDGDCPVCANYVAYLRLRESVGRPRLVNLRDAPGERRRLIDQGFQPDDGMVAEYGDRAYAGADATHLLALLSTGQGVFNRINAFMFRYRWLSVVLYPLLRCGRNTLLFFLGRSPIAPRESVYEDVFRVFSLFLGLFAVMHFLNYGFEWHRLMHTPMLWPILPLGIALTLRPNDRRIFVTLAAVLAVDAWLQAPIHSNHTILLNFFLVGVLLTGTWTALRGEGWSSFVDDVVPVGRMLLMVMYVFGVFHKINSGFLDPDVSCAVKLWQHMPWPLPMLDGEVAAYAKIYGTLIVETGLLVCLLVPAWRPVGVGVGIAFHLMLVLSGYKMYASFTALTLALHTLFLTPATARSIWADRRLHAFPRSVHPLLGGAFLLVYAGVMAIQALQGHYTVVGGLFMLLAALPVIAVIRHTLGHGVRDRAAAVRFELAMPQQKWLVVVPLAFFINCTMPYMGLKTSQSMNMFANLRLAGDVNNHYVAAWTPGPFDYLSDTVQLLDVERAPRLEHLRDQGYRMVFYDFLDHMQGNENAVVSYRRNGQVHRNITVTDLEPMVADRLHHPAVRKWFHFRPFKPSTQPRCGF